MSELKVNLLYLIKKSGNLRNVVKFLNNHIDELEILHTIKYSGEWMDGQPRKLKVIKYHIGQGKDEGRISIIIDGHLIPQWQLEDWKEKQIFYVYISNMSMEDMDKELNVLKKSSDDLRKQMKINDPYDEEEWLENKKTNIITSFKLFENNHPDDPYDEEIWVEPNKEIKKGDKVICINNDKNKLILNKEYTISHVVPKNMVMRGFLYLNDIEGIAYNPHSFIKVDENMIFEKMSISSDVRIIADNVLYQMQKNPDHNRFVFSDVKILGKFNIKNFIFEKTDEVPGVGAFYKSESVKEPEGWVVTIRIKKNLPPSQDPKRLLTSLIYHEVQHMVDYVIKQEKNVKSPKIDYHNLEFINDYKDLHRMLYMCHDSEMKSRLHEVYVSFKYYLNKKNIQHPTSEDVKKFISEVDSEKKVFWVCYKYMMKYNIMEKIYSDNDIKKAIEYINSMIEKKIPIEPFNKEYLVKKLMEYQKYIRETGLKYRDKAHKVLFGVLDEYNKES